MKIHEPGEEAANLARVFGGEIIIVLGTDTLLRNLPTHYSCSSVWVRCD